MVVPPIDRFLWPLKLEGLKSKWLVISHHDSDSESTNNDTLVSHPPLIAILATRSIHMALSWNRLPMLSANQKFLLNRVISRVYHILKRHPKNYDCVSILLQYITVLMTPVTLCSVAAILVAKRNRAPLGEGMVQKYHLKWVAPKKLHHINWI